MRGGRHVKPTIEREQLVMRSGSQGYQNFQMPHELSHIGLPNEAAMRFLPGFSERQFQTFGTYILVKNTAACANLNAYVFRS